MWICGPCKPRTFVRSKKTFHPYKIRVMFQFPSFRRIQTSQEIDTFANTYLQCSGFKVPRSYYEANQVFGIYQKGAMIGGFVLGTGSTLRTLEVFAASEHRDALYQHVQQSAPHTEMCCFWIHPICRNKTRLNFFVWFCVAYALRVYGTSQLIFGTNSVRLAALYSAASKSSLLHADYLNHKQTFIFTGPRQHCLLGVAQILYYKTKRLLAIRARSSSPLEVNRMRAMV